MQKIILLFSALTICFFSLSCEKSNPVADQGKPSLTASENPVVIALNYSKNISVTGGKGSYKIKSMTDSSIVQVNFYQQYIGSSQILQYVDFAGKKIGTTKVVIQDSAKTAEVEIIVTVAVMVSSPSTFSVKTQQTKSGYINGGTSPYKIIQPPNSAIATVTLTGSSITVTGISQGTTSVTISDNANPSNSMTIPITVTIPPSFTTAGKISFASTIGDFQTEGIYGANNSHDIPSNDAGVGGFVTKYRGSGNFGQIIGYKKKTSTQYDIIALIFFKNSLTPGTVTLDTGFSNIQRENGSVMFGFNLVLNTDTNPLYSSYSGDLTLSIYNEQKAEGNFNGKANRQGVLGNDVTISQGLFSVPLIAEDGLYLSTSKESQIIFNQIEKMIKPQFDKMKMNIELRRKF